MIDPSPLSIPSSNRTRGACSAGKPSIDPAKLRVLPPVFSSVNGTGGNQNRVFAKEFASLSVSVQYGRVKKTKSQKSDGLSACRAVTRRQPTPVRAWRRTYRRANTLSEMGAVFRAQTELSKPEIAFLLENLRAELYRFNTKWLKKTKN
jgi:hypothetical protein